MFEVGDIIAWSDKIQSEQYDYIGLIIEDRGNGIFDVQPLSPQFIEEVEKLGDETIRLRLNGFKVRTEWRKLC
jgi:hypothetical protein